MVQTGIKSLQAITNMTIVERFWEKVAVKGTEDCWELTASVDECGYGKLNVGGSRWERAHRLSYQICKGDIPKGERVCHSCDNPGCCNPKHLWLGSHQENMTDMAKKGRSWGTRLTETQVLEIRKLYSEGSALTQIASQYGVAFQHVSRIVNRRSWKHLP